MVLFYGLFGLVADVALYFNLCLIIGTLSVLGATLTLPGIAGSSWMAATSPAMTTE
jgi:preprotein translocase subunit SecD